MMLAILLIIIKLIFMLLLPLFYIYSPTSASIKLESLLILAIFVSAFYFPTVSVVKPLIIDHPVQGVLFAIAIGATLKHVQRKLRYYRLNSIKKKYGYTEDHTSWEDMTLEQAQEIESNIAEYEFPRLFQFAWISDFLRTATDPGVSRAMVASGHILSTDLKVAHDRLQATIHLTSAMVAHKIKSPIQSLVISTINEHHHRYGSKINSDDVLYLTIHFGFASVKWINLFGYRKLEEFEIHALWVLWREIGCCLGVKYIPKSIRQALEWQKNFEKSFCWQEDSNNEMAMAILDQVLWPIPSWLVPFFQKLVVSILDSHIIYYCKMENLGPSPVLRNIAYAIFRFCGWLIREFGLPRLSPYKRQMDGPDKNGLMTFQHHPYDTLPFYLPATFWNRWGYGALYRRIRGMPVASAEYFGNGVTLESMGVRQRSRKVQVAVEDNVRCGAKILEESPYGYRPDIGFQAHRLIPPVDGPEYGLPINQFPAATTIIPASVDRFDKQYEHRGLTSSHVRYDTFTVEDVTAFNKNTANNHLVNNVLTMGPLFT